MKKSVMIVGLIALVLVMNACQSQPKTANISIDVLRDKIAGGWAGKMIGVSYGAKSEFRARGETF